MLSTMRDRLNSPNTNVKIVALPRYIASLVKSCLAALPERQSLLQRSGSTDVKALGVVDAELTQ